MQNAQGYARCRPDQTAGSVWALPPGAQAASARPQGGPRAPLGPHARFVGEHETSFALPSSAQGRKVSTKGSGGGRAARGCSRAYARDGRRPPGREGSVYSPRTPFPPPLLPVCTLPRAVVPPRGDAAAAGEGRGAAQPAARRAAVQAGERGSIAPARPRAPGRCACAARRAAANSGSRELPGGAAALPRPARARRARARVVVGAAACTARLTGARLGAQLQAGAPSCGQGCPAATRRSAGASTS